MFNIQFFKRNRLGMTQICQRPPKSCPSTLTTSTRSSPTSGYDIFSKTYMAHVLYPIFQERSIRNGLRYVRGLQVMLIDVNVNQAECHKWVRRIFKNPHRTCFISYSSSHALEKIIEKLIENGLRYVMSEASKSC